MNQAIFFYSDRCPHCERVLPEIVDLFNRAGIPLVIRKPTLVEMSAIPGYPTLALPAADGIREKAILLVGAQIAEKLRSEPELLNGSTDDSLPEPSTCDGKTAV